MGGYGGEVNWENDRVYCWLYANGTGEKDKEHQYALVTAFYTGSYIAEKPQLYVVNRRGQYITHVEVVEIVEMGIVRFTGTVERKEALKVEEKERAEALALLVDGTVEVF